MRVSSDVRIFRRHCRAILRSDDLSREESSTRVILIEPTRFGGEEAAATCRAVKEHVLSPSLVGFSDLCLVPVNLRTSNTIPRDGTRGDPFALPLGTFRKMFV